MSLRAVCFDLGGVIVRTVDHAPRLRLAKHLGLTHDQLVAAVFDSPSSAQASLGKISETRHWELVVQGLGLPLAQFPSLRDEFFSGDRIDGALVDFLRDLRGTARTGLISNAWSGLRAYIEREGFADAFNDMVISAEVGIVKPDARIYQLALERLGAAPEEAVFVDDMPRNIEAANALGMRGILFRDPQQTLEEIRKLL